ncbi:unnamed protein product [Arabidopsis halleri]
MDKRVRLYDVSTNSLKGEFLHGGAVLDSCFHDEFSGFSVGADNKVRRCYLFSLLPAFLCGLGFVV